MADMIFLVLIIKVLLMADIIILVRVSTSLLIIKVLLMADKIILVRISTSLLIIKVLLIISIGNITIDISPGCY